MFMFVGIFVKLYIQNCAWSFMVQNDNIGSVFIVGWFDISEKKYYFIMNWNLTKQQWDTGTRVLKRSIWFQNSVLDFWALNKLIFWYVSRHHTFKNIRLTKRELAVGNFSQESCSWSMSQFVSSSLFSSSEDAHSVSSRWIYNSV